jgi:hypothetical protein
MALRVVTGLGAVLVCALIVRAGYEFLQICRQEATEVGSQGQLFTSARGAMVIIGGVSLVGFHFLVQVCIDVVYVITGQQPPAHWIAEAHGESI